MDIDFEHPCGGHLGLCIYGDSQSCSNGYIWIVLPRKPTTRHQNQNSITNIKKDIANIRFQTLQPAAILDFSNCWGISDHYYVLHIQQSCDI